MQVPVPLEGSASGKSGTPASLARASRAGIPDILHSWAPVGPVCIHTARSCFAETRERVDGGSPCLRSPGPALHRRNASIVDPCAFMSWMPCRHGECAKDLLRRSAHSEEKCYRKRRQILISRYLVCKMSCQRRQHGQGRRCHWLQAFRCASASWRPWSAHLPRPQLLREFGGKVLPRSRRVIGGRGVRLTRVYPRPTKSTPALFFPLTAPSHLPTLSAKVHDNTGVGRG